MNNRESYFAEQFSNFSSHDQITIAARHLVTARNEDDAMFAAFLEGNLRRHRLRASQQPLDSAIDSLTAFAVSKDPSSLTSDDIKLVAAATRMVACSLALSPRFRSQLDRVLQRFGQSADTDSAAKLAAFHIARSEVDLEKWSSIDIELFASSESALLNEETRTGALSLDALHSRHDSILARVPNYISEYFFFADNLMYLHQTGRASLSVEEVLAAYRSTVLEALRLSGDPNLTNGLLLNWVAINEDQLSTIAVPASSPLPLAVDSLRQAEVALKLGPGEPQTSYASLKDHVSFAPAK